MKTLVTRTDEYGTEWIVSVDRSETIGNVTVEQLTEEDGRPMVRVCAAGSVKMILPSIKDGLTIACKKANEIFDTVVARAKEAQNA